LLSVDDDILQLIKQLPSSTQGLSASKSKLNIQWTGEPDQTTDVHSISIVVSLAECHQICELLTKERETVLKAYPELVLYAEQYLNHSFLT
jgi:hypothetical protein